MTTPNQLTYAAVITITLPGADEATTMTVILTPADPLEVGDGRLKPLRDCTLAELQAYALDLENQIAAEYHSIKLGELVENSEAQVQVALQDEHGQAVLAEDWPTRAIVRPEEGEGRETEDDQVAGSQEQVAESDQVIEDSSPHVTPSPSHPVAPAPLAAEETPPAVTVAPAEPVHPEREALKDDKVTEGYPATPSPPHLVTPPLAVRPAIRIAGRRRPLGHPTWTAVDILINEPAFRDAQAHALSSLEREVAGVLIGPPPEKQPDGRYLVHVSDTIIAKHTRMHGASVTYTPESWRYLNDKLVEMYPDESAVMVGWYHTHPGFGIFLSGMDQFIHQNFFTQVWHVALVLDPLAHKSGFFCWDRPKREVKPYDFPWPDWAHGAW
ncbi:MAG: hypothetical protein AB1791_08510 [Chloroflexota bacterium]